MIIYSDEVMILSQAGSLSEALNALGMSPRQKTITRDILGVLDRCEYGRSEARRLLGTIDKILSCGNAKLKS